jgi:hypothetical protein
MEEWRVINNYPNYSVSNLGNVMNTTTNRMLKPTLKGGYHLVSLVNTNGHKPNRIHRLVAMAFIPNPENKAEVNHKNKIKTDNRLENLEWMTHLENMQHKSIGLVYKSNKHKPVFRHDKRNGSILQRFDSIEDAGVWATQNQFASNAHNGRNAIGNCLNGLSSSAYGFAWTYDEIQSEEGEEWREIDFTKLFDEPNEIDASKHYFVSNLGRFRNSSGIIMADYKVNENGYIRVFVFKKTFALHRLVAMTFLDNPENKEHVNHKDGEKLNNAVENLEWCTNQENQIHKFQAGLGNNFTRKIKQYDLEGNLIQKHDSITSAAKEVGVSKDSIRGVLINHRKTSAGFVWKYDEDEFDFSEKITINPNIGRPVGQYDLDNNLVKVHKFAADAWRETGVHKNNIRAAINNIQKTAGGFVWKYLD